MASWVHRLRALHRSIGPAVVFPEDLWMHIDGSRSLVRLAGVAGEDKPVQRWQLPNALLGEAVAANGRDKGKASV